MKNYIYEGPVMLFERCIKDHWEAETIAESPSKARSNLMFRYKKQHNMVTGSKIILPGKIREV